MLKEVGDKRRRSLSLAVKGEIMGDPHPNDDQFPQWILFERLKPLVNSLRELKVVLRRTSSSTPEWTQPAVDQLVSLFKVLRINTYNETDGNAAPPSDVERYILLHGGEGAGREREASMYAKLPPNRLVILVKSKRVLALEGLSSKDHVRIKIDHRSAESMQEVVRRIVVLLGAQRVVAAPFDCVKWSESPEMVVVKKERNVSLGLSITTRQVDDVNYCHQIVLIKRIEKPDGRLEKLKRYMHIQSVNGILLDDLDCEAASKKIRDISEGQVFLMVRAAHRDHNKAGPSPLPTPLGDPPPLPPPPTPVWEGVCRFNANPFMLTWEQKEVSVVVQPNQVQLIPAFIVEPKETPRKVAIVSYISCDVITERATDPRGHLVVGISDRATGNHQSALGKSPDFIKSVINRRKEEGVTLALYLCQGGPKHLAEQTYSDYITNLQGRRGPEEEEDLGIGEPDEQMLNPVIPSNHQYSPVYITGSKRSDSSRRLFQMMTRGESTAVHPTPCSDCNGYGSLQPGMAGAYGMGQKAESLTVLDTPSPGSERNLFTGTEAGRRAGPELSIPLDPQLTPESSLISPNSPVDLGRSGSDSSSVTSRHSTESGHSNSLYVGRSIPVLLSSQLFNLKWEPVSTASMTTQDGQRYATPLCKYMLQNVDCKKLKEAKLSLNPSLELLYVKPNTICVYTINLEQLSTTPHEVFSEMCDFLSLFQSLRKPVGMQVILAAVYDSTTEYGMKLQEEKRDWLFPRVSQALKSKFNEILHEDDRDRIEVVPVDLAECEGSAKRMQAVIGECVNRYYQRVEGIDKDTEKMPLQQWPLFRQKVVELAYRRHVVSWEELANLARQFLWIEEGELFEHCLTALEQSTSLWVCQGAPGTKNSSFLVNPDIVVNIISRLADPNTYTKIRTSIKKEAADLLRAPSSATQSVLNMMVDNHPNLAVSGLIQWMQTMGILFESSGGATRDPCYFVPSITSSAQWNHGQLLPHDISNASAELFIELRVPGTDTPPMPTLFFYQFVAHIISMQGIDAASNLSVSQDCTRVKISSLKLTGFLMPCEAVLSYDRLQCIIRIQLQPWQGAIIPTAHAYFRDVLKDCEANYGWKGMARAIMGPAFRAASSNARCATLFAFLTEALAQPDPNYQLQPATFVVDADSLKEMSTRGIEPQLHVRTQDGKFRSYKVSEIVGLNQWIYDPTLLYENKEVDVNRMKAMNKVAEWLLQDPAHCAVIACENGIIHAQDPEAHTWANNTGPVPAAYKLIHQWHARKLPISRLREALQKHHHNAAANILQPFCDGMPQTEL